MPKLYSIFVFLRIIDPKRGTLSLTDIGTWLALIRIAMVPQPSLADLTALCAMFLAQHGKKTLEATNE